MTSRRQPRDVREITWRMLPEGEPRVIESLRDALVIREGDLFLLTDSDGNVPLDNHSGFGLYHDDMRYLSGWELDILGLEPVVLVSTADLGYGQEQVMTNPELRNPDGEILPSGSLEIRRLRVLDGAFLDTVRLTNYSSFPVMLGCQFRFDADFADLFELRGVRRRRRGRMLRPRLQQNRVTLAYKGLDDVTRRVQLQFEPMPDLLDRNEAVFSLHLDPGETSEISGKIVVDRPGGPGFGSPRRSTDALAAQFDTWLETSTSVTTNHDVFNIALERAITDLRVLWTERDGHKYTVAGVPWFNALFGRDSALTALMSLAFRPEIAREVLRTLAASQGQVVDVEREEEPGKIIHEVRYNETANTGEVVFGRYFGSVDSTPLFVLLAAEYYSWTADLELMREICPALLAALRWIDEYGDLDGDGFYEYEKKRTGGLDNQGWKDSWDGIIDEKGAVLRPPIALVEVQGYVYAAKRAIAKVFEDLDLPEVGERLRHEATSLKKQINDTFWVDDRFYALALDKRKNAAKVLSSNAGQLLWSGAPTQGRARRQIARLMHNDMFSGWGLRTLSNSSVAYNPLGYHRGTVWPHDNALILAGFKRYGAAAELNEVATGLVDAAFAFPYLRLPELFSGSPRTRHYSPVPYPVACRPQAFAASSLLQILASILGLAPDAANDRLYIVRPLLPHWLETVRISGLKVGQSTVDLSYERRGRSTRVEVLSKEGPLEVIQTSRWPSPAQG